MADEIRSIKQRFGIIGNAPGLNYALSIAVRVAPTNLTVLITGESGVGKEIFSQVIHQNSPRKHGPFIAVNCGAIPEGTIDSELFGHVKGSFTNAVDDRKGYFETVNGGTIFLDEIGEMPLGTQARLLRVLETGEFIRVGSSKVQKTDVRVVAATNVDLHQLIQTGRFREDLFYRLNTVPIRVPALRERHDDIYLLSESSVQILLKNTVHRSSSWMTLRFSSYHPITGLVIFVNWKECGRTGFVLSGQQTVSADDLRAFLPDVQRTSLPMLRQEAEQHSASFTEREIFYKVLYDMKKDLNDLKQFVLTNGRGQ